MLLTHVSSVASRFNRVRMCKELRTRVLRLSSHSSDDMTSPREDWSLAVGRVVEALVEGEVVAVPTDTLYGLACAAQSSSAVESLYRIKGRSSDKPLAVCVGDVQDVYRYCRVSVGEELLRDLLPGPVTLVLERSDSLNSDLNPFTTLVGVRVPDHPFTRRVCQLFGEPLALTSANISSHTSPLAAHEFEGLWPRLAVVVDGGTIAETSRAGSTVVDLSEPGHFRIIRPGCALTDTLKLLQHKHGLLECRR